MERYSPVQRRSNLFLILIFQDTDNLANGSLSSEYQWPTSELFLNSKQIPSKFGCSGRCLSVAGDVKTSSMISNSYSRALSLQGSYYWHCFTTAFLKAYWTCWSWYHYHETQQYEYRTPEYKQTFNAVLAQALQHDPMIFLEDHEPCSHWRAQVSHTQHWFERSKFAMFQRDSNWP